MDTLAGLPGPCGSGVTAGGRWPDWYLSNTSPRTSPTKAHAKAQEAKAARAAKASKGKGTKVKPPTRKTRSALSATTTAPTAEGLEL